MSDPAIPASKLSPQEIGQHLRCPHGDIGLSIATKMSESNAGIYAHAFRALGLENNGPRALLEIGYASGRHITQIFARAPQLSYTGVDISPTMQQEAQRHNAERVSSGHVDLRLAAADALPFAEQQFDAVLAMNVIYFWQNPQTPLNQIFRVLGPEGRLVLGAVSPAIKILPVFAEGFTFYEPDELKLLLQNAGFKEVTLNLHPQPFTFADGKTADRDYFIVTAIRPDWRENSTPEKIHARA